MPNSGVKQRRSESPRELRKLHYLRVRERAVRLVQEARKDYPSQWAVVESIAPKIGCAAVTLHEWVKKRGVEMGDRYDKVLSKTINGLYKTELIHHRAPWKTVEAVELATFEWVTWFNHQRLLEPIGYILPAQAEKLYYRQLATQAEFACT